MEDFVNKKEVITVAVVILWFIALGIVGVNMPKDYSTWRVVDSSGVVTVLEGYQCSEGVRDSFFGNDVATVYCFNESGETYSADTSSLQKIK